MTMRTEYRFTDCDHLCDLLLIRKNMVSSRGEGIIESQVNTVIDGQCVGGRVPQYVAIVLFFDRSRTFRLLTLATLEI